MASKLIPTKQVVIKDIKQGSKEYMAFIKRFLTDSNRAVDLKRVKQIAASMSVWGWQGFITVIETRAFSKDGSAELYVVDGQHRLWSVKELQLTFDYIVVEFANDEDDTKENVIKYMADLNSASQTWCPMDYVKAYCSLDSKKFKDYLVFAETMQEHNLIPTTVLCLYTNVQSFKSARSFYNGEFKIENKRESREMLQALLDVRQYLPPLARVQTEFILMVRRLKFNEKIEKYSEVVTAIIARMKAGGEDFPADKKEFKDSFGRFLEKMF